MTNQSDDGRKDPGKLEQAIERRHSPRAFSDTPVQRPDLSALLEAARWAPSSYNEQPWRFLVAASPEDSAHERIARMLNEHNRKWAREAPVLMLTFARTEFARNDKVNPHARHDVGLAVAQLTIEAVSRDIFVHQMAGIREEAIIEEFSVPEPFEPVTGLAIGYPPDASGSDAANPRKQRQRLPKEEIAFEGDWGNGWGEASRSEDDR
jgi:nitroreductase